MCSRYIEHYSEDIYMQVMKAVSAGLNLCNLIEQAQEFHEPIMILRQKR